MADIYEKAIVTNSLSKTYSFPGIRIGWTVSSPQLANKFRTCRDYTLISGGVINDILAQYVLKNRIAIIKRNASIIKRNTNIVQSWIDNEPRVSWIAPQGVSTAYILLDIPISDEEFCLKLLKDYSVLLVPGSRFELPSGARLGYCTQEKTLEEGLKRISCFLRTFDA